MATAEANLVLKFRLGGENHVHMRRATRIRLDKQAGLTLTDPRSGFSEMIPLRSVEVLSIQSLSAYARAACPLSPSLSI